MKTAKIFVLSVSILALGACDRPGEEQKAEAEDKAGYTYFTVNEMRNAAQLRQTALAGTQAYDILEDLVTTAPKRLAGSEGDKKAVEWAVKKFNDLGYDRVWTEPVTLQGWARKGAVAHVITHDNLEFNITSLGLSTSTPEGGLTAEVVHFPTYEAMVEADPSNMQDKIVFISNKMERARDGSGYGPAVIARTSGPAQAGSMGAKALLIRSIGTDDSDAPHTGMTRYDQDGPKIPAAALSNQDADVLQAIFENGETVSMHVNIQNEDLGEITTYNVIGEITGSERAEEIVLTGGHLDAWDLGVGAMDDGFGVTITMTAGHLIGQLDEPPARSIRVVAFAAEETGLHGGFAYAKAHEDELANHVIGIESDFGVEKVWEFRPNVHESAMPVMREMWRVLGPMGIPYNPDEAGFPGPDLIPMVNKGMPGAALFGDGTRYFDLHHTANDQLDQIRAADMDFNVGAYAAFLYLAAEHDGYFDGRNAEDTQE